MYLAPRVYSVAMRGLVRNLQIDLAKATPKQVREAIEEEVADRLGREVQTVVKLLQRTGAPAPATCGRFFPASTRAVTDMLPVPMS